MHRLSPEIRRISRALSSMLKDIRLRHLEFHCALHLPLTRCYVSRSRYKFPRMFTAAALHSYRYTSNVARVASFSTLPRGQNRHTVNRERHRRRRLFSVLVPTTQVLYGFLMASINRISRLSHIEMLVIYAECVRGRPALRPPILRIINVNAGA